jgi:amidase
MKGKDAIVGYAGFVPKGPADFNSPLVDILLDAGAILYVKTNVPQTLWVGMWNISKILSL